MPSHGKVASKLDEKRNGKNRTIFLEDTLENVVRVDTILVNNKQQ